MALIKNIFDLRNYVVKKFGNKKDFAKALGVTPQYAVDLLSGHHVPRSMKRYSYYSKVLDLPPKLIKNVLSNARALLVSKKHELMGDLDDFYGFVQDRNINVDLTKPFSMRYT